MGSDAGSTKRLGFIDVMYGICTLLVIFGHSHPLHCDYPAALRRLTEFIYCFHMPCFFYIGGFLIRYTGEGRDVRAWWAKKCQRLLFPYIVLTLAAWAPKVVLSDMMNDKIEFSIESAIRVLLIPREGVWGHLWFVPTYLALALVGALWLRLWKSHPLAGGGGGSRLARAEHLPDSDRVAWDKGHYGEHGVCHLGNPDLRPCPRAAGQALAFEGACGRAPFHGGLPLHS